MCQKSRSLHDFWHSDGRLLAARMANQNEYKDHSTVPLKALFAEDNLLVFAGVLTWALVAYITLAQVDGQSRILAGLLCLLFLAIFMTIACDWLQKAPPWRGQLLLLVLAITALGMMLLSIGLTPILLVLWATLLPEYVAQRHALLMLVVVNAVVHWIVQDYWALESAWLTTSIYVGFELFAYSSSLARNREAASRVSLEHLNQQLVATQALLSQTSQQRERQRISRDLHDILGHQLTALALQLEVLRHTAPVEVAPQISSSQQLAKELLASIRAVVQDQNTLPGLDLRAPLMTLLRRLPGIELKIANFHLLQSAELAQSLLLALQEGISNAIRHGGATQLHLTMLKEDSILTLRLSDNGRGMDDADRAPLHRGLGLSGMIQRLAPFKGRVQLTQNSDTGCCLTISVEDTASHSSIDIE